ncbi:MAG TPA: peptide chain release factor-like protein [Enhygromyxa sp.]|nr:peptide chain release factor-like protein [Enhygromyxa sp.]
MTGHWELWISAGTGPLEARRFVALLAERLARACEDAGLSLEAELRDSNDSPRSIGLRIRGDAERALDGWLGTHELVHDSRKARSGRHRGHRKRWFASVSLTPVCELRVEELDPRDVELRFARSGGPGGQHVNTSATAVQARHRPTGIAVRVSDSRSQAHNRELALARLCAKLGQREAASRRHHDRDQRARRFAVIRGRAIASWQIDGRHGLIVMATPATDD